MIIYWSNCFDIWISNFLCNTHRQITSSLTFSLLFSVVSHLTYDTNAINMLRLAVPCWRVLTRTKQRCPGLSGGNLSMRIILCSCRLWPLINYYFVAAWAGVPSYISSLTRAGWYLRSESCLLISKQFHVSLLSHSIVCYDCYCETVSVPMADNILIKLFWYLNFNFLCNTHRQFTSFLTFSLLFSVVSHLT